MSKLTASALALCLSLGTGGALAQERAYDGMTMIGKIEQESTHMGSMTVELDSDAPSINDRLVFEPFQMAEELKTRDDLVFLMRHGPTDWSYLDEKNVSPTNCDDQRVMSPQGRKDMENLGLFLAANFLLPSKVLVSEWCRNQQTLESVKVGIDRVVDGLSEKFEVETDPNLNLLLSLQGARDVQAMRETISAWDGGTAQEGMLNGPLLMISHFTNIEEITNFKVFEGEILVVDPKRENRVIGYLRLASASADIGHFNTQ